MARQPFGATMARHEPRNPRIRHRIILCLIRVTKAMTSLNRARPRGRDAVGPKWGRGMGVRPNK